MAKQFMFNEKPTDVANLGEDIQGAARHNNDTYETPEELRAKAFKKQSSKDLKALLVEYKTKFELALHESTEAGKEVLKQYEFKKTVLGCDLFKDFQGSSMDELRAFVLASNDRETRNILRKKYNSLCNKHFSIKFRIRPIQLKDYFETKKKETFKEINGHEVPWKTSSTSFDKAFLASRVRAVQYGNSVPENERVYVSEKLVESIKIMDKYFQIDFKSLGFSFGARGKAGSIAHYQDGHKVIAINRGWDGAWVHELGHAIDYALDLPSDSIPYEMRSKYRAKINSHPILKLNSSYYMKPKEIFARLFEAYVKATIPEATSYMIFLQTDSALPDLDADSIAWITKVLQPIQRKAA